jgi:hypothetical protein
MEKRSSPDVRRPREIQALLLDRVLDEPAQKAKCLSATRMNDDMVLSFRHDPKNLQYKYVTGKASDGKTYIGIMPFGDIHKHEDILNALMNQFNVKLDNVKGGWAMISNEEILLFGHSTYYPQSDHETVENAIRRLMPEMSHFDIGIESFRPSPLS